MQIPLKKSLLIDLFFFYELLSLDEVENKFGDEFAMKFRMNFWV